MSLTNTGIYVVNEVPAPLQCTFIIMGIARSGTTMAAKVLQALGVDMGADGSVVLENTAMANLLEKDRDDKALAALVAERNAAFDRWGWKRPEAFRYHKRFLNGLRNPRLIILYRDPLAIALREHLSMNDEVLPKIHHALQRYQAITEFVAITKFPVLMVSYEKAVGEPREFAKSLGQFAGAQMTDSLLDKAAAEITLNDATYLEATTRKRSPLRGVVEKITRRRIKGWAAYPSQAAIPTIVCSVNGREVGRATADEERPDLSSRLGKLNVGFTIEIDPPLAPEDLSSVVCTDLKQKSALRVRSLNLVKE